VVSVGFSGGAFGGGSNRQDLGVPSFFQTFGGRTDFDVLAVWSLQNMGFGNAAVQKRTRAERDMAVAARGLTAIRIAREVGDAWARSESKKRQVAIAQRRLQSALAGSRAEVERTRGGEGLPIEAINSVNLLAESGRALVKAVGGYDLAQFELFVAIGQTPHAALPDPHSRNDPRP
jgi:outer membrane protein TolC